MKELLYNGKPMDPEPHNGSLQAFAEAIENYRQTVVVQLEPGDATHYSLLIAPCWSDCVGGSLDRYGIPPTKSTDYLFVSKLHDERSQGCFIHNHAPTLEFDVEPLSNNRWSQEFLAWWLTLLWEAINGIRTPALASPAGDDAEVERPASLG